MNALESLIGQVTDKAAERATAAAEAAASRKLEENAVWVALSIFMAVTTFVFYVVPRMRAPWKSAS